MVGTGPPKAKKLTADAAKMSQQQTATRKRKSDLPLSTEMSPPSPLLKPPPVTPSRVKNLFLLLSLVTILYLLFHNPSPLPSISRSSSSPDAVAASPTHCRHLIFSIAASSNLWPRRSSYVRLWYSPNTTRALAFLDRSIPAVDPSLPPVIVSGDTSRFPYTFPRGLRSAIRVARIVKEAVDRVGGDREVRWFVFGDDDTVFIVENLVKVLAKYDHDKWFYVGGNSESYEQNVKYSFDMAFGGGGFAISASLARVLARVLDSCLMRYSHLYGSDSRIFSCLAELGVGLTHEPGFHQIDIRGNLFGLLSAHPLSPFVSLHHLDAIDPIFPEMNRTEALEHLFKAVNADPARIFQQSVCYDRSNSLTVSVAWGYSIEIFEGSKLLPDLLSLQKTFTPWRRGARVPDNYMFNTREYPRDPCERPVVFFLEGVASDETGVWSNYARHVVGNCSRADATKNLERVRVFSHKLELDIEQMKAPRRQCCDLSPSYNETMMITFRQCRVDELISMDN